MKRLGYLSLKTFFLTGGSCFAKPFPMITDDAALLFLYGCLSEEIARCWASCAMRPKEALLQVAGDVFDMVLLVFLSGSPITGELTIQLSQQLG